MLSLKKKREREREMYSRQWKTPEYYGRQTMKKRVTQKQDKNSSPPQFSN